MSDALRRWAEQPGPTRLLREARRRLEAGHAGDRVRLAVDLDAGERSQAGRLLGIGWQTGGDGVTLGRLRTAVTAAGGDLGELLVAVAGGHTHRLSGRPPYGQGEMTCSSEDVAGGWAPPLLGRGEHTQMTVVDVDLSRFNSLGYGTVHGDFTSEFTLGQVIAVTDDDADTLEATVIALRSGAADLQVHWDRVRRHV